MPFYFRKSLSAGIFRFNLSKSGLGVSTGIRGFRLGVGPRGNYVHLGSNGFYYRASLPGGSRRNASRVPQGFAPTPFSSFGAASIGQLSEIDSANILQLTDTTSTKLLSEINQKYKIPIYWLAASSLSTIGLLAAPALIDSLFSSFGLKLSPTELLLIYLFGIPCVILLAIGLYVLNQAQKTIVLFYTMDGDLEAAYQTVHDAFQQVISSGKKWHLHAQGRVQGPHEIKLSSGASTVVRRTRIFPSLATPKWIKTNVTIPSLPVGRQVMYFFPDRILMQEGKTFGSIEYADLQMELQRTRFIEEETLPADAQIVDKTWKYPNKDGSPDRRFSNNYEIPIVQYGELHFWNARGLNEILQLSNPAAGEVLQESLHGLARAVGAVRSQTKSEDAGLTGMAAEIAEVMRLGGFEIVKVKPRSNHRVDMLLRRDGEKWITRFEDMPEVSLKLVQEFKQLVENENAVHAMLITSGSFAGSVAELFNSKTIGLLDGKQFEDFARRAREVSGKSVHRG